MKKLTVHIHAELIIPEEWEVIKHTSGVQTLKIGDKFIDFDIAPLATEEDGVDATWTDEDEELTNTILMAVTGLDTTLEIG